MPLNQNFILKCVGKDHMIIPLSDVEMDFSKVYNVSSTGALIYKGLERNLNALEIAKELTKEYEVTLEQALLDTNDFILELKKRGIYHD